tara:strand:+ start:346 stop:774 length:429 start_codon:yes stop_codon:yes gene_type:complete
MPEMPEFLKRPPPTPAQVAQRDSEVKRMKTQDRGARIKMPVPKRLDPRTAMRAAAKRSSVLTFSQSEGKVTHPSTEAVKTATSGLTNDMKRAALYSIALENGIEPRRWDDLNNGQVSMNLSNTLRGRYYKNQTVIVGGKEIE